MTKKIHINTITKGDNIQFSKKDFESIFEVMDGLDEKNLQLISENEQLKKEKEELEERNKRQYERLKQIGDLMLKRDWKTLNDIVNEWEKQKELLQAEWGTYCGDKE